MLIALLLDDPNQRAQLSLWLEASGHTCMGWESLADLQASLSGGSYDALLLDWMIPGDAALDALKWARQTVGWNMIVLVLTTRTGESTVVQALEAGADDYLVTPTTQQQLLACLANVVRRPHPAVDIPQSRVDPDAALGAPESPPSGDQIDPMNFQARIMWMEKANAKVREKLDQLEAPKGAIGL